MSKDPDAAKGAVAQDRPDQPSNTSMEGQNAHRGNGETMHGQDTDFPEPGENEEHSMEGHTQHSRFGGAPAGNTPAENDQDPGERQKRNQNDRKEDPLAS